MFSQVRKATCENFPLAIPPCYLAHVGTVSACAGPKAAQKGHCDSASPTPNHSPWGILGFQHQTCLFCLVWENYDSGELLLSRSPLGEVNSALDIQTSSHIYLGRVGWQSGKQQRGGDRALPPSVGIQLLCRSFTATNCPKER